MYCANHFAGKTLIFNNSLKVGIIIPIFQLREMLRGYMIGLNEYVTEQGLNARILDPKPVFWSNQDRTK